MQEIDRDQTWQNADMEEYRHDNLFLFIYSEKIFDTWSSLTIYVQMLTCIENSCYLHKKSHLSFTKEKNVVTIILK